ncbi:hypothetical protein BJX63DRAFT_397982 [Aspergillus granulosus]|uniref:Uncharacterized protein n=1 Tax=Aspergillus granulosus TaxID=176169 RepID=A0ABR4H9F0_9EURO
MVISALSTTTCCPSVLNPESISAPSRARTQLPRDLEGVLGPILPQLGAIRRLQQKMAISPSRPRQGQQNVGETSWAA